ncbi:MAG: ATP-binding protein [Nitrospinae bacterium]|nr:ATP-binding protein [Nitrospinota bacterium]
MDKQGIEQEADVKKLKSRIQFLEKENQWFLSAMEVIASMGDMHRDIPRSADPNFLFTMARRYLNQLLNMKSLAFFLINEEDHSFFLANGESDEENGRFQVELDHQIENGTLAWALKQNRPLLVKSELFNEKLFLHVLGTRSQIKGIVMGRLGKAILNVPLEMGHLISIVLHNTANALENGGLYKMLSEQNKNLERTVQSRTLELENKAWELKKNIQELKDFTFIASHDLQEPLRKVISFGERLRVNYNELLDDRAKNYIAVMEKASMRMQKLIDGLLQLSRVTTKGTQFQPTRLEKLMSEVLVDLESTIAKSQAQIIVGDLPTVIADETQMRQLFTCLTHNAVKFNKPGVVPEISIASNNLGNGYWEILVHDNGIGIDEKYNDRIFKPFERLHGRSEREGIGMGLALCQKIVTRHGGTIKVKSKPDKGSTFIITLPEKGPGSVTRPRV